MPAVMGVGNKPAGAQSLQLSGSIRFTASQSDSLRQSSLSLISILSVLVALRSSPFFSPPEAMSAKSSMAAMEKLQWDPLSDEELKFCWQCLVDQGQLTTAKLQKFMLEVTGDELTPLQASDLLGYLDATGDGRVGMEEFRHFMSTTELDMTDPQTFLWSPTKSFRERLGLVRVAQDKAPPDAGHV